MTDYSNDTITEAYSEYEKLHKIAEERDYQQGWIFYRLKEKFGQTIAQEVMPHRPYSNMTNSSYKDRLYETGAGETAEQFGDPYAGDIWGEG